ncbi:hypothetical protein BDV09DRAFT_200209 [Aspergillus tetrazonus]
MPPVKRKAPTKPWYEVEETRASQARKIRRRNASLRNDPFKFLSDTLAGHVLNHLDDIRDFGCAELVTTRWRDIVAWWGHRALIGVMGTLTDEEKNKLLWGGRSGEAGKVKWEIKEEDVVTSPRVKVEFNELNKYEDMGEDMMNFNSFWSDNGNGNAVKIRAESASGSSCLNGIKSEKTYKDIGGADETARKYKIIKQAAKRYVSLRKIAAGNASSGRSLENVDWVVSAGEYVVWAEGPIICSQDLGFQSNGSLYPINRVNTRGWCDNKPDFWVSPGGYLLVRGYDERERYFVDTCIHADNGA